MGYWTNNSFEAGRQDRYTSDGSRPGGKLGDRSQTFCFCLFTVLGFYGVLAALATAYLSEIDFCPAIQVDSCGDQRNKSSVKTTTETRQITQCVIVHTVFLMPFL